MARCFLERGGTLRLRSEFVSMEPHDGGKRVHTRSGRLRCRYLVNTLGKATHYPDHFERGLPVAMYWLVLGREFRFPEGVHTHIHYPPDVSRWSEAAYRGEWPAEFGFHAFTSDLGGPDRYTANVYFYLPRGVEQPDEAQQGRIERFLFPALDRMLPGIGSAIRERYFVSPEDFRRRHRLSGRVLPVITPPGFAKPPNYCAQEDVYYAGAAAFPPGDHAGAAVRSGALVAELVRQRLG
jgi:phytoene dehydrogenase-like protein